MTLFDADYDPLEDHLVSGAKRHLKALDVHLGMIHDYDPSHSRGLQNAKLFASTWRSQWSKTGYVSPTTAGTAPKYGGSDALGATVAFNDTLAWAETFHVTADMVGFIADVADTIPDDYLVDKESMPAPFGVLVLDTPIEVVDVSGDMYRIDTIVWATGEDGWTVMQFTDKFDCPTTREQFAERGWDRDIARKTMLGFLVSNYNDPVVSAEKFLADAPQELSLGAVSPMTVDKDSMTDNTRLAIMSSLWIKRFTVAAWAVMHGKIGRPRRGVPSRQQRKKIKAAGLEWGDIRVVQLRGVTYTGPERETVGHNVEWTHRWMVKGFWRWQWYPQTKEAREAGTAALCAHCGKEGGQHKRIFIDPYVKGPEDLPYLAKDVVYAVNR